MIPSLNSSHEKEGMALVIDQFANATVMRGILASWLRGVQRFENVLAELLAERTLPGAVGLQLEALGSLVGELRNGRADLEFEAAIRLRVLINRSQGRTEDVLGIIRTLTGVKYLYSEPEPAYFRVYSTSSLALDRSLIAAIRLVKPAGVQFEFQGNSLSAGPGIAPDEIQFDHAAPYIVAPFNGGLAHTSGIWDNAPIYSVSY